MFCNADDMTIEDAIERLENNDICFTTKELNQLINWLYDAKNYHKDLDQEYQEYLYGLLA